MLNGDTAEAANRDAGPRASYTLSDSDDKSAHPVHDGGSPAGNSFLHDCSGSRVRVWVNVRVYIRVRVRNILPRVRSVLPEKACINMLAWNKRGNNFASGYVCANSSLLK